MTAVLATAPEGGYVAFNPETGTATQGETLDEVMANLREVGVRTDEKKAVTFLGRVEGGLESTPALAKWVQNLDAKRFEVRDISCLSSQVVCTCCSCNHCVFI